MTDIAIDIAPTDIFGLNASNFHAQSSSTSIKHEFASQKDSNGDVGGGCESAATNETTEAQADYGYCGTDIVTDLGTMLTTFGEVVEGYAVNELTLNFSREKYPEASVSGHNHTQNPHAAMPNADVSDALPASVGGIGCPEIWANSASATSGPIQVSVKFSLEHIDEQGDDNNHWVGTSQNFRVDVTATYLGAPTLTTTGWKIDSQDSKDGVTEADKWSITAHKFYARNV